MTYSGSKITVSSSVHSQKSPKLSVQTFSGMYAFCSLTHMNDSCLLLAFSTSGVLEVCQPPGSSVSPTRRLWHAEVSSPRTLTVKPNEKISIKLPVSGSTLPEEIAMENVLRKELRCQKIPLRRIPGSCLFWLVSNTDRIGLGD